MVIDDAKSDIADVMPPIGADVDTDDASVVTLAITFARVATGALDMANGDDDAPPISKGDELVTT